MAWNGLAGGGWSDAVRSVEQGIGDALRQWDVDAAGGVSQRHRVALVWVGWEPEHLGP